MAEAVLHLVPARLVEQRRRALGVVAVFRQVLRGDPVQRAYEGMGDWLFALEELPAQRFAVERQDQGVPYALVLEDRINPAL
jgi:hypothetical protein